MWRWDDLVRRNALSAQERLDWITAGLQDTDQRVRLFAIRWAAERRVSLVASRLRELLTVPSLSRSEFAAIIAALSFISTGKAEGGVRDSGTDQLLLDLVNQQGASKQAPELPRDLALQVLGPAHPQLTTARLYELATGDSATIAKTAVRHLVIRAAQEPQGDELLLKIIGNATLPNSLRADALVSLTRSPQSHQELLAELAASPSQTEVSATAQRILAHLNPAERSPEELLSTEFRHSVLTPGDAQAGWRVFYSAQARCALCHQHSSRGANVGPDLNSVGVGSSAEKLLDSIVHPSREVAPLYVPWTVLTNDGRLLTGLKLNGGGIGNAQRYLANDGSFFDVDLNEIDVQKPTDQSIMPDGLLRSLSDQEIRDLLTFLQTSADGTDL
jgi:putative heme-binding domain-containing protein